MRPRTPRRHGARRSAELAAIAIAVVAAPPSVLLVLGLLEPAGAPPLAPAAARGPQGAADCAAPGGPGMVRAALAPLGAPPPADDPRVAGSAAPRAAPEPEGEGDYYERFVAQWRSGEEARRALERDAPRRLRASASTAEQVALLRALRDLGSPASADLFALALRELPDVSSARGVSVPAFAVSYLGRARELTDAERDLLEEAVRARGGNLAATTRGTALRVLLAASDGARREVVEALAAGEPDPLVRAIGEQARRARRVDTDTGELDNLSVMDPRAKVEDR